MDKKAFASITKLQKELAFTKASEYISKQNLILTEREEYRHFLEYYKLFFQCLPELDLTDSHIELIAKDLVYNRNKYIFYNDAVKTIHHLSKNFKLAVVSDAWPSLENVFKQAGLRDYFSSFAISSVIGVTKPNELMYKTALEELCVSPDEAIFIDDSIRNCNGALKLGIRSFVLCRDWRLFVYYKLRQRNYHIIRNLTDIKKLLV